VGLCLILSLVPKVVSLCNLFHFLFFFLCLLLAVFRLYVSLLFLLFFCFSSLCARVYLVLA
jgi:hypothetical protein